MERLGGFEPSDARSNRAGDTYGRGRLARAAAVIWLRRL